MLSEMRNAPLIVTVALIVNRKAEELVVIPAALAPSVHATRVASS